MDGELIKLPDYPTEGDRDAYITGYIHLIRSHNNVIEELIEVPNLQDESQDIWKPVRSLEPLNQTI